MHVSTLYHRNVKQRRLPGLMLFFWQHLPHYATDGADMRVISSKHMAGCVSLVKAIDSIKIGQVQYRLNKHPCFPADYFGVYFYSN